MSFLKSTGALILTLFAFSIGCSGVDGEEADTAGRNGNEAAAVNDDEVTTGIEKTTDFDEPIASTNSIPDPIPAGRSPADSQVEAPRRLEKDSRQAPQIRMEGGVPRFVNVQVPLSASLPDDPEAQALDFLGRYRGLYRLEDPGSQFKLNRIATDANTESRHLFFSQHRDGVPVFAAELAVHLDRDNVIATNGNYLPEIPRFPEAAIDADQAKAIAHQEIASGDVPEYEEIEAVGEPELMYFDKSLFSGGEAETHLAWRLNLRTVRASGGASWLSFVDAHNGAVLLTLDEEKRHAPDKDFDILTVNNTTSITCWNLPWETADDDVADHETDPNGVQDADARNALIFAHQVYDHFYDHFHRHSWGDNDEQVEVMVHVGDNWRNASYSDGCENIQLGDGMVTLDIFAHEYTHGVTDHTADLIYADQPGALNESYSDVFAAMVDTADWTIGEGSAAGTVRNMGSPRLFGHPDHMSRLRPPPAGDDRDPSNDWGSVHTNSGIPNKAAYLIAEGGVHNGVAVVGIGREKTQQLYYGVLTMLLTENSQLRDARDLTVLWAQLYAQVGLFDFTGQDVCSVVNAFASVGLGDPDLDCDGLSDDADADDDGDLLDDGADNCPTVANSDQADLDRDVLGDACDPDDDNDGLPDGRDNCPVTFNSNQADLDRDGRGDLCDDSDGDGRMDAQDNCPTVANPYQTDSDRDGRGDACDDDDDNDGRRDEVDNCAGLFNSDQRDTDRDGRGDACDNCNDLIDADADGLGDVCDNCPTVANRDQANSDADGLGNACDSDDDNDGVPDAKDNCPILSNPDQRDNDANGTGLLCDRGEQYWLTGRKGDFWQSFMDVIQFQSTAGAKADEVLKYPRDLETHLR